MRITKQIAVSVSEALTAEKFKEVALKEALIEPLVVKLLLRTLPSCIIDCFNSHPSHFKTRNYFNLVGNGFNHEGVFLSEKMPYVSASLSPDLGEAVILRVCLNNYSDLKNKTELLKKDIENTIFGLKTYKAVELNFPEAFSLLPKINNAVVALDLSQLRKRLV